MSEAKNVQSAKAAHVHQSNPNQAPQPTALASCVNTIYNNSHTCKHLLHVHEIN